MNVTEQRFENFLALLDEFKQALWMRFPDEPERGMLKKFAEASGLGEKYGSHIYRQYKTIGHRTARKLEAAFGKPEGWMDVSHRQPGQQPNPEPLDPAAEAMISASELVEKFNDLPPRAQRRIERMMLKMLGRTDQD